MSAPTPMALNEPSVANMLATARRLREEIGTAVAGAEFRLSQLDDGLRPEIRREREGIVRAEARAKVAEALARARALRETVTALRGMNSRLGSLGRSRFSAADGEDAAIGAFWLARLQLMTAEEIAALGRERATAPGGAALGYLAHLVAREKIGAIGGEEERQAAAALQGALESVPCEVDELAGLLAEAEAECGRAELAAMELGGAGDPAAKLRVIREHGITDPWKPLPHPAESAAAAGGGEAA